MLKMIIKIMLAIWIVWILALAILTFSACSERKQITEPAAPAAYGDFLTIGTPHLRPSKVFLWADTVVIMDSNTVVIANH